MINVTPHFASFRSEQGIDLELKSACHFKTERFESLKNVRKQHVQKYYSESFPRVASKTRNVAFLDIDFELNKSSNPLAKNGNKFIDILKASITLRIVESWS